jgi:superfamily II DNA/RNA helicase
LELASSFNNVFINEVDSSGKTLSYLIPIMNGLLQGKSEKGQQSGAVIVTVSK